MTPISRFLVLLFALAFPCLQPQLRGATATPRTEGITLLPSEFSLTGPGARQSLVVESVRQGRLSGEITNLLNLTTQPPGIVKVENGTVIPLKNGSARILVSTPNGSATARVTVKTMETPRAWTFRNHVQPVLSKTGCNSGACHGAAAGQNGFKLSLRGYDDDGDHAALTRNALGRRVVPSDAGRSLLLLKATGTVPHKGGKRFEPGSLEYQVLSEWIAAGTPGPQPADPRIERLEIEPKTAFLKPGQRQQLIVRAHFSDGHQEDVTRWTKFSAANAAVATVDDSGRVQVIGPGEGAITAWYLSRIDMAHIRVPFEQPEPGQDPTVARTRSSRTRSRDRGFIDALIDAKLADLNLPASPTCTDGEFIRRVFLDTLGILPTPQEVKQFVASTQPGKRDALIDQVLTRPEFVDYWTYKWSDLLLVQSTKLKPAAVWAYSNWIRDQVAANRPWDQFARSIVTARGSTLQNGAGNFYVLHEDPRLMAETVSQAFLGMSINCARCHNHPMEKWTNDEYFGFANLFARVRMKAGRTDGEQVLFVSDTGDVLQPLTGKPQPPRPLDGNPIPLDSLADRREPMAQWLVSRNNPYFSRAIVNRIWANFMGVGLVEAVDDLRITNPASNEELLAAAAAYLADQRYDLKALMRAILRSEAYQRSSEPVGANARDARFHSRHYPRRLMAEVLLDAVSSVTGIPTKFGSYPAGWRALQLPDVNVDSYFLKTFGRPDRATTCECERTTEPSVTQMLHLSNGDTINTKLTDPANRIGRGLEANLTNEALLEEIYLAALARTPTPTEQVRLLAKLPPPGDPDRRRAFEDLLWALLSSREFLFNH